MSRGFGSLFWGELGGASLATLQTASPAKRDSGGVFPLIRIERWRVARDLIRELLGKLVQVPRPFA